MPKSLFRCLVLICSLATIFFIACSRYQEKLPDKKNPDQEKQILSKDVHITDRKKLLLWHIQLNDDMAQVIKHSVDRFMIEHSDIEVEAVPLLNDPYKIKLMVAMGTRNPPDIFATWGGGPLYEYIKAGQIKDITSMIEEDHYKDYFLDSAIDMVTYDGRIWGIPVENCALGVIFYNKEIFKQYDISKPKTYHELLEIVKLLRSKEVIPFALANRTKWPGSMYYMYFADRIGGAEVFKKAATREGITFEHEAFIKAGEKIQELVKLGAFPQGFNGLDHDTAQSRHLLYSGKAAMQLMGTWDISMVKTENKKFYEENLDFFPFPELEGGEGNPQNVIGTFGDNFYSISSECKYPQDAFELLTYLIDAEAVKERTKYGHISPIKGYKTDDPALQRVLDLINKAPSVQLWYDQYLPPELGEKHKDTCQALFDGSLTPQQAAKEMEDAAKKYYKSSN